ncbi:uncharacterized protein IL334_005461 [Kwoniella shivajii]|uniref:Ras-GAP domain-containing protein n=1 Tax=Kwoniella shivajii TaxID=564305 RepID=A0ABZ1D376_9TREE|nr:hypothetical protein IL334_005461 [Kwoniella shivajii]
MSPLSFQAEITYRIAHHGSSPSPNNGGPVAEKKKRSLGLRLLRPKSTHGGGRDNVKSPEPMIKPFPIPPPPEPDSENKDDSWTQDRYDTQRATLRHTRSIPQLTPLSPPTHIIKTRTTDSWRKGVVVLYVHGKGGNQGGGLIIYDNDEIIFKQNLNPLPDTNWSTDDIQFVHPSVYDKPNVISVALPSIPTIPSSASGQPSTNGNGSRQSSTIGRPITKTQTISSLSKIGKRARGYTITKIDSNSTTNTATTSSTAESFFSSLGNQIINEDSINSGETSISPSSINEHSRLNEQILLLDFGSEKERWEWFTLLRSFCGSPLPRLYRRLQIRVLDLQESIPISGLHLGDEGNSNNTVSFDQSSSISTSSNKPHLTKPASRSDWKCGWAGKDKLKVEIYADRQLIGQTTWAQAEDRSEIPFWAELFTFENLREFSTCTLKLCRLRSNQSQHFATVRLSLVPGFMKAKDERYPISSLSGNTIGELRLIVSYSIVNVVEMGVYPLPDVFRGMGGTRTIYYMMSKGLLDQIIDLFTRFNWALGTTYNRLVEMSEIEAKSSGDILFRGNSPMTRLLEATMRLVCFDFLKLSIGPTITLILENEIEANIENTRTIMKVLDYCWDHMYTQRGSFPNILRQVFAVLFKDVKENHEDRRMRYKAISSFLFLRLIGPALMRPHLFGLAKGLPRPPIQKTLMLIAKIFHTLAFFTSNDTARDPEIARYSGFIRKNHDMMIDYLSSFAIPLDDFQCQLSIPSPIATFLAERIPLMPPEHGQAVPMLTVAGPVEVDADAAIFYELLYQRRKAKVGGAEMTREDGVIPGEEEEMVHLIRTMDTFISSVHNKSYERERECEVDTSNASSIHTEPISPSRPSLQIDISSAQRDRRLDLDRSKSDLVGDISTHQRPELPSQMSDRDKARDDQKEKRVISPSPPSTQSQGESSHTPWKWLTNLGWMSPTFRSYDNDVTNTFGRKISDSTSNRNEKNGHKNGSPMD